MLERVTDRAKTLGGNLSTAQRIALGAGLGATVVGGAVMFGRSKYPGFEKIKWGETEVEPDAIGAWVKLDGDPEARRFLPKTWQVGILALSKAEMLALQHEYEDAVPALAQVVDDKVHVGPMPENHPFFGCDDRNLDADLIGVRLGSNGRQVTAGLWQPEANGAGRFYAPEDVTLLSEEFVPINRMPELYPQVPFVK